MLAPSIAIKPERCHPTEVKDAFTIKPYKETQAKAVTDIYHKNTGNQVLAIIRNPEPFEWKIHSPSVEFQTVIDKKGIVIGYYVISQTATSGRNLLEIGVANAEACKIIFNKMLDYAKEKKLTEVICPMSPRHPFAQFAYWQNVELRTTMASGAGFVRILNMTTLFGKIRKELESRLIHSEFYNKTSSVAMKTGKETITFLISDGEIIVSTDKEKAHCTVEAPLSSLNPLVTGYKSIHELVEKKEATINIDRAITKKMNYFRLVNVLFPKSMPYDNSLPLVWE